MRRQGLNNARVDHIETACGHACRQCCGEKIAGNAGITADQCATTAIEFAFAAVIAKHAHRGIAQINASCAVKALFANPRTPSVPNIRGMSPKSSLSQVILPCTIVLNGFTIQRNSREHVAIPAYCGT